MVNAARVTDAAGDGAPEQFHAYRYEEAGWVVSVGNGAVAQVGPAVVSGDVAKAVKATIGASHLGSVGAIEQASELVHEELGWPGADAVDLSPLTSHLGGYAPTDATDPSSLGELESRLVNPLLELSAPLGDDEVVDLTGLTRPTDREYPGSPANRVLRAVLAPAEAAVDVETVAVSDGDDEGADEPTG